ncbi:MAG: ATP-dependent RNA helicase HrpA [Gammaproteobacteria bacterium]
MSESSLPTPAADAAAVLMVRDARRARQLQQRLAERISRGLPHDRDRVALESHLMAAAARATERAASIPTVTYPAELPVAPRRDDLLAALRQHPVVIICGETGSGKTTQLPKLCLEAGSGRRGMIGHTQPRRLAARTVAARIAEELQTPLGAVVGFKVRFTDRTSAGTLVKLMTDGVLLAELREDPDLTAYDTLIIDEAHERSLNIDFLLGVLQRLRQRRPDLRIVITSATIETARFAAFFADAQGRPAPVLEVSGRAWPVETRYRPLATDDDDDLDPGVTAGVLRAVEEIRQEPGEIGRGDMLVFLPGEREIRDTAEALEGAIGDRLEVMPLYSRLGWDEQQKVFRRGGRQRVVLATNVAETSLTVPGIRSVIDVGTARISRYSARAKIQRLPVEPVSQASADQRRGRCGRVGPGLCIRLYGEDDYGARVAFTAPEVLRTNLASVILQMETLGLGTPQDFPFIDPPDGRQISDGYRLLQELEAVDDRRHVTPLGRQLARLPVDPRLGRMLVEARRRGALREVLVLAAVLSMQDPRERPQEAQAAADARHAAFADPDSDFSTLLKLWAAYQAERGSRSRNALRRWCREQFLSAIRMREWEELHAQLATIAGEMGWPMQEQAASYEALHRSLLAGLLGNIGLRSEPGRGAAGATGRARDRPEKGLYDGARGLRFQIAPGTPLRNRSPRWLMAGNIVETQRIYARLVAGLDPAWIEQAAHHLVKRSHGDPVWDEQRGQASIAETVTLYGLTLSAGRRVPFANVDPAGAREFFIREALVHGRSRLVLPFLAANRATRERLAAEEAKLRRHVVLKDETEEADLYLDRVPADVHNVMAFSTWWKGAGDGARAAFVFSAGDLRRPEAPPVDEQRFPDRLRLAGNLLPVAYVFDPARPDDGATVTVPYPLVSRLDPGEIVGAIPGWRIELVTEWIRALPKHARRQLVPAPDVAAACVAACAVAERTGLLSFVAAAAQFLTARAGEPLGVPQLERIEVSPHLRLNFRVVDATGRTVAEDRNLEELRRLARRAGGTNAPVADVDWQRSQVRVWDFAQIPERLEVIRQGVRIVLHPALEDGGDAVNLTLEEDPPTAARVSRQGVARMAVLALAPLHRSLEKDFAADRGLMLLHQLLGPSRGFARELADRVVARAFYSGHAAGLAHEGDLPVTREAFEAALVRARPVLHDVKERLAARMRELLEATAVARKELASLPDGLDAVLVEDVRAALARQVFAGFVAVTPDPWLEYLPKYVKTTCRRAAKLRGAQGRVLEAQFEQRELWRRFAELQAAAKSAGYAAEVLHELRWTLEEYALSVFAQDLKATLTVSPKRVNALFDALRLSLNLPSIAGRGQNSR